MLFINQSNHLLFLTLLCDTLQDIQINPGLPDCHHWAPSHSGVYSSKSAYEMIFMGDVQFEPSGQIWGTWAPPRCKFFTWLASLNCCWTADRLAHRDLDHLSQCLLCDQEEETIHHIMGDVSFL
jgi:hypothetical protein